MDEIVLKPELSPDGQFRARVPAFDREGDEIRLVRFERTHIDGEPTSEPFPAWLLLSLAKNDDLSEGDESQYDLNIMITRALLPEEGGDHTIKVWISDDPEGQNEVEGTFIVRLVQPGYRFFRLTIKAIVGNPSSSNNFCGVREVEIRETPGGPNVLADAVSIEYKPDTPGTGYEQDVFGDPMGIVDGSYAANNGWGYCIGADHAGLPAWIVIRASRPIIPAEVAIGAYPTSTVTGLRSTRDFDLEASEDGQTWVLLKEVRNLTWTTDYTQPQVISLL